MASKLCLRTLLLGCIIVTRHPPCPLETDEAALIIDTRWDQKELNIQRVHERGMELRWHIE